MKTLFFWLLLFILLSSYDRSLGAQNLTETDSLLQQLRVTPDDTNKIKTYARLGWIYGETNSNTTLVRKYADSIRMLSQKLNYAKGIALSHFYYGFNARHEGNYDEALAHLHIFIKYFAKTGDSTKVANGLFHVGVVESIRGNYERSLSIYFRILNIYKFKQQPYGVATALSSIGISHQYAEKYDKAIACFRHALQILDSLENGKPTQAIAVEYGHLGSVYLDLQKSDSAKRYFLQFLKISNELGNDWGVAGALENLGYIAFNAQNYAEALAFHNKSLTIREQLAQKRELALSLSNVGTTYLKLKDYRAANRYLMRSLNVAREIKAKSLIYDIYKDLATLAAERKDFVRAYDYHKLYATIKDSVLNEVTVKRYHELQTKYETAEKDKRIALLAKEKIVQQKEMLRQSTLNRAYVGGIIFVITVSALLFYIVRQRMHLMAKDNKIRDADFKRQLSELEMKALRAQINPHFLFNCMNAINLMILKGHSENASIYLSKFSKLVRLILENAEAAAVTLESEMMLLESYIQLEELRLPGRIGYTISVDESIGLQNTYLPSMVLQPVVENAIWHGIVHKENESKGNISIEVRQHEDQLLCTIEDNGVGRERSQQLRDKSIVKNKSMGMKITEERLRLRSRNIGQCLQITDLKDKLNRAIGTRVTIHIPIEDQ